MNKQYTVIILAVSALLNSTYAARSQQAQPRPRNQDKKIVWHGRINWIRENLKHHVLHGLPTPKAALTDPKALWSSRMDGKQQLRLLSGSERLPMDNDPEAQDAGGGTQAKSSSSSLSNKILLRFGK